MRRTALGSLCNNICGWNVVGRPRGARLYHHHRPRFFSISGNCINKTQYFALNNFHSGENRKMSQASSNNQHSFNTTNSFNTTTNTFNYLTPDDESKILAWLSPLEPGIRHRDIGAQRLDSIGSWLLETQEFRRWHGRSRGDGDSHRTLFCHGNPGAGKSYMM